MALAPAVGNPGDVAILVLVMRLVQTVVKLPLAGVGFVLMWCQKP